MLEKIVESDWFTIFIGLFLCVNGIVIYYRRYKKVEVIYKKREEGGLYSKLLKAHTQDKNKEDIVREQVIMAIGVFCMGLVTLFFVN